MITITARLSYIDTRGRLKFYLDAPEPRLVASCAAKTDDLAAFMPYSATEFTVQKPRDSVDELVGLDCTVKVRPLYYAFNTATGPVTGVKLRLLDIRRA